MYVQCERCKSEYDFDDALVSERGTTVKCTHCGHQFKVRRSVEAAAQDRWVVRTVSGKEVVFTSLRELQKAIMAKQVGRQDSLARGGAAARLLGAIAELEPFFDGRKTEDSQSSARPPMKSRPPPPRTPVPPPMRSRVDTMRPPAGSGVAVPPPPTMPREATSPMAHTMAGSGASALASATAALPAPEPQNPRPPAPSFHYQTQQAPQIRVPEPPSDAPTIAHVALAATVPQIEMSSPLPPPTAPIRRPLPSYGDEASGSGRGSLAEEVYTPPRRRMGGWIVATVLLIGVGIVGFVLVKPYLMGSAKPAGSALSPLDPRAQQFLSDGERAMLDGNLVAAKENFDKASVVVDRDPRVLIDMAKLDVTLADVPWLEVKLDAAGEAQHLAKGRLDEAVPTAKKAADDAYAAAPDDPASVRVKIDALRIEGNLADARALVARIAGGAPQPDTAYVLAMLDLAEPTPPAQYTEILDRLRLAAAGEGNLGRARAALVYALARSGDQTGARKELERLLALPRTHPLLGALRAYLDHAPALVGTPDAGTVATVDINTLPNNTVVNATNNGGNNGGNSGGNGGGDPRSLLQHADDAKNKGDLDKAKSLYGQVVAQEPTNSEALAGLGDISERQHDLPNAKTYYQQALNVNGGFLPARVGLANVLWESGDKSGGAKIYKEIVDSMPEGSYQTYVKERAQFTGGGAATPEPQ